MARGVYTRRQEGMSIWVVPSAAITASDPADKGELFEPAIDKIYRHPTFLCCPMKSTTCKGVHVMHATEHAHLAYVLRLADNALILGQRNTEWCSHGPARWKRTSRLQTSISI